MKRLAWIPPLILLLINGTPAAADSGPRREFIQVTKTAYVWIVGAWDFEVCRILTGSPDDIPQAADIAALCDPAANDLYKAGAAFLFYGGHYDYREDIPVSLPEIQIQIDFDKPGRVTVTASDPLPGAEITRIDAAVNGIPTAVCYAAECFIDITPPALVSAFATSSQGDKSKNIVLRIGNKVSGAGIFIDPKTNHVIIGDVAYTQYSPYMDIPGSWRVYPKVINPPRWLEAAAAEELNTTYSYYYLAGQFFLAGLLGGDNCPEGAIIGQYATTCGVIQARELSNEYQNKYNAEIAAAADTWGVPSTVIKRIIAIESQFWPGALGIAGERGLYQLTREGADTLLRWNGPYYLAACRLYWDYCDTRGYDTLEPWQQELLISYALGNPNDINTLAATLKANAFQVGRLVENISQDYNPGPGLDYVGYWKLTVINYHAGATVTAAALQQLEQLGQPLTWDNYRAALERVKPSALDYLTRLAH